jgi:hypothetical protein
MMALAYLPGRTSTSLNRELRARGLTASTADWDWPWPDGWPGGRAGTCCAYPLNMVGISS